MYFITAIYHEKRNLRPDKIDTRTFGFYENLDHAFKSVEMNYGNMHECLYNYLVIEEIGEGIHSLVTSDYWFEWKDNRWERLCSKPECFNGIVNWSIG